MASAFDGLGLGQLGAERNYMKATPPKEGQTSLLGLILGNLLMPKQKQPQTPVNSAPPPVANVVKPPALAVPPLPQVQVAPINQTHPETDYVLKEFLGGK